MACGTGHSVFSCILRPLMDPLALLTFPVVALLFLGLHHHARWSRRARAAFVLGIVCVGIAFAVPTASQIAESLKQVPEWDYLGFWLHARTAVLGQSFYDPASAQALAEPFEVTSDFREEIVDTGFWYPPPSMFLFLPLGGLEPATALPLWIALQGVALALSTVLLWRIFFPGAGSVELCACAALILVCGGTYSTFYFSQTCFVALLAVLLFWRRRTTLSGGVALAAAVFVKPLLAALAAEALLRRRGKVLAGLALATVALLVASVLAFGAGTLADYFTRDPLAKPAWIYSESTNQSLLGLVLRTTGAECSGTGCVANPIFLAGAAVLGVLTLAAGIRLARRGEQEGALSLFLLLALIVYPVSQLFYSVFLLPLVLVVWRRREQVPGGAWTGSLLIAAVLALTAFDGGRTTLFAFLLLWTAMVAFRLDNRVGAG